MTAVDRATATAFAIAVNYVTRETRDVMMPATRQGWAA